MMSKNSIIHFLKDYLIKFLIRPFLLDTNERLIQKNYFYNKFKQIKIKYYETWKNGESEFYCLVVS